MTDLNHRSHEETSALKDLEELAAQFEDKCGEASTWKTNFEKLQIDFGERTSELESLNSQLHKAKQVGTISNSCAKQFSVAMSPYLKLEEL